MVKELTKNTFFESSIFLDVFLVTSDVDIKYFSYINKEEVLTAFGLNWLLLFLYQMGGNILC